MNSAVLAFINLHPLRMWFQTHIQETGWQWIIHLIGSALILAAGIWASRWIARFLRRLLDRAGSQPIVASFVTNLAKAGFIVCVIAAALLHLGIPVTPVVTILGAAGLAVGLALQGTLSNLASGVLLAILRPFNVGDYIEIQGLAGQVEAMHIFQTRLVTQDNRLIIMPNSLLTNQPLINYTFRRIRRVDLIIDAGYSEDIPRVKAILREIVDTHPLVLKEPEPVIGVLALAANSVQYAVRPWVRAGDFVPAQFQLLEQVKTRFDAEGIEIPFPQRVVRTVAEQGR